VVLKSDMSHEICKLCVSCKLELNEIMKSALVLVLVFALCYAHNAPYEWGNVYNEDVTLPKRQRTIENNPTAWVRMLWKQIAYGQDHELHLTADGKLYSSGSNLQVCDNLRIFNHCVNRDN
jgi:alpha-tubulin suppressor-like RCC1 family protein